MPSDKLNDVMTPILDGFEECRFLLALGCVWVDSLSQNGFDDFHMAACY